jgi:hypothetical protein
MPNAASMIPFARLFSEAAAAVVDEEQVRIAAEGARLLRARVGRDEEVEIAVAVRVEEDRAERGGPEAREAGVVGDVDEALGIPAQQHEAGRGARDEEIEIAVAVAVAQARAGRAIEAAEAEGPRTR